MRVAIIPARGGSKRIPRKNIRRFNGRPMIGYSIAAAMEADVFERVIVSTDDPEIADIARSLGAEIPFIRPKELSDDYTGTTEVVAHAIESLGKMVLSGLSAVCCIYATVPLINAADVRRALEILESGGWRYVFAATDYPAPIFRAFHMTQGGAIEMYFPEYFHTRSQDCPESLHDAGQFYWGRPDAWIKRIPVFGPTSTALRLPRWRVQDIDTEDDWQSAERLALALQCSTGNPI